MKRIFAALVLMSAPAFAAEPAKLKPIVVVDGPSVTLGDLLTAPAAQSGTAIFASPEPGETGVIQASRIVEAARGYGVNVDTPVWAEVSITRAARLVSADDMKKAIALKAADSLSASIADLDVSFTRIPSSMKIETDAKSAPQLSYFSLDALTGRFEARLFIPGSAHMSETAPMIATGTVAEMVDVVKLKNSATRGQPFTLADVELTRIKRATLATNAIRNLDAVKNMVARRQLGEDTLLRSNDLEKAQAVARNEMVLITYETPSMSVTTRGKALSNGSIDDVIEILNPVSKRTVMATVVGQGKVVASTIPAARRVAQLSSN